MSSRPNITPEKRREYSRRWLNKPGNREKQRQCAQRYRAANPERRKEQQRRSAAKRYASVLAKKRTNKVKAVEFMGGRCVDCGGVFPPCVYAFHHLDPATKDANPATLMMSSWRRIQAELEKCVLLYTNCHLVRHHAS